MSLVNGCSRILFDIGYDVGHDNISDIILGFFLDRLEVPPVPPWSHRSAPRAERFERVERTTVDTDNTENDEDFALALLEQDTDAEVVGF